MSFFIHLSSGIAQHQQSISRSIKTAFVHGPLYFTVLFITFPLRYFTALQIRQLRLMSSTDAASTERLYGSGESPYKTRDISEWSRNVKGGSGLILLERLTEITKPVMTANKAAEVRTDCLSNTRRGLALHDRNACSAPVLLQLMQLL